MLTQPYVLMALSVLGSILLVTRIPFMAFKFDGYGWHNNRMRYLFACIALVCIATWHMEGIALSMLLYIVFGSLLQKYTPLAEK